MGLLDNTTQQNYYQSESNYGNYQFTSLEDIINQFMVAYVGEGKIISKARKTDVAFHAQRAMQELSFDTFKSIKSQEIVLPPSNTMILPHDYVNYTRVLWSDSSGIKHPIYPTKHTQNPFKITQDSDGYYDFSSTTGTLDLINPDFGSPLVHPWFRNLAVDNSASTSTNINTTSSLSDILEVVGGELQISTNPFAFTNNQGTFTTGRAYSVWQEINVTNMDILDAQADGLSAAAQTNTEQGVLRIGISSTPGDPSTNLLKNNPSLNDQTTTGLSHGPNFLPAPTGSGTNGLAYVEWSEGTTVTSATTKFLTNIDVSMYNTVYVLITSYTPMTQVLTDTLSTGTLNDEVPTALTSTNTLDDVVVTYEGASPDLVRSDENPNNDSTTWTNYKSHTPNENVNPEIHSYDTDIYDFNIGERYGLDPQHAQVNGSFYIDDLKGLIHFSSNISGKTVILDYISDSLGTDGEMQVHKFAEEAMYKWIMYAILSTRANTPEYIVRRYQKEKFAATRQAKLRLSNIKLEELTQILRGKSKHIKH